MSNIVEQLKMQQHRDSTRKNYYLIWKIFNRFFIRLDVKPTSWEDRLTLFVGHLIDDNKQSSTVKSYISAIKAVLLMNNIDIAEDRYLLGSLIRACRLRNDVVHTWLPIKKSMLTLILRQLETHFSMQPYLSVLYRTIVCTTYYGLLRVSEVMAGTHAILARDVQIRMNKKKILLILRSSKTHSQASHPQLIKISASDRTMNNHGKNGGISLRTTHQDCLMMPCPYKLLRLYASMRGNYLTNEEQFFVFSDRSPVLPQQMSKCLKTVIREVGFDETLYGTHSLRAGRTCDLYKLGLSVETIKKLGRSRSNAVFRYLKC